jgi:hypothetical protein
MTRLEPAPIVSTAASNAAASPPAPEVAMAASSAAMPARSRPRVRKADADGTDREEDGEFSTRAMHLS